MTKKHIYIAFIFLLIFSFGCNEDNNSSDTNLPQDFDLTTSECPAEDIIFFPNQAELIWSCARIDTGQEAGTGSLSSISFMADCFTLESKADNWCLITPLGRSIFSAKHVRYNLLEELPPLPDEDGCRIDETVVVEDLECELVSR